MTAYRLLTKEEIACLEKQACTAECWEDVQVAETFTPDRVRHVRFSGKVRLGVFEDEFRLAGGVRKRAGLCGVMLHNVTVGDNCLIENVKNYIANYEIEESTFIENVDIILTDGCSRFGNGVEVPVLNEAGGCEVIIHDRLSAQQAYIMALYRHRPQLIKRMVALSDAYADTRASDMGRIGSHVCIVNTGCIRNVRIGDCCRIEGAGRLKNGTIGSNASDPVHIGYGVVCDDFIISSGADIGDGTMIMRCFVGQACRIGHNYSASDSLFFSNCQGEHGEACAIFAGPFTVTHHKSTLLIAGMFSFMNAGSGSNQSNHMYKLGPVHQGMLERGVKTASGSYILWPACIGAFSLVAGRHVGHPDTSDLPFSYLIEDKGTTYLVPGVNLRSAGTIRDAQKWPGRDLRKDPVRLDQINYNLLNPFIVRKVMNGRKILKELERMSEEGSDLYSYQDMKIKKTALDRGIRFYESAIHKYLGGLVVRRLEKIRFGSNEDIRRRLQPDTSAGTGEWVDMSGLIAPESEVERLMNDIETGIVHTTEQIHNRFAEMHARYYTYEWTWAYRKMLEFYGLDAEKVTAADIASIVRQWQDSLVWLDRMVYEDARKDFSLTLKAGPGQSGEAFESTPFAMMVLEHIKIKTVLGKELLDRLEAVPG